jgi:VWFA-related protein
LRLSYPQVIRIAAVLFITLSLVTASFAQTSTPPKRKKTKDFGSSLRRLKKNTVKKAAETRSGQSDAGSQEEDVIRIDTSLVSSDVLVLDQKGNTVAGLTADDFSITEDNDSQAVGHFFTGDNVDLPRTIVLIIDYSGSQLPYLENSINAAKILVDKLGPKDLIAIVTDDVELLVDFTTDKKKLKERLEELLAGARKKPGILSAGPHIGQSKQYSALMATLNELFQEEDERRIVIFQTDGDEIPFLRNSPLQWTVPADLEGEALERAQRAAKYHEQALQIRGTQFSLDDLYRAIERERVTVYTVIPGMRLWGLPPEAQLQKTRADQQARLSEAVSRMPSNLRAKLKERLEKEIEKVDESNERLMMEWTSKQQAILAAVATLSGGWAEFLETPEQADAIYSRIFSDINQRYIVGYYPTNKERDGKRRKIEIKVKNHPEYQVYGRWWYIAPGP